MKSKSLISAILMIFLVAGFASALPNVEYVKLDGDVHDSGDQLVVKRGETLDIRIKLQAGNTSEDNVKAEAYIDGYEYDDYESVRDSEHTFDMESGDTEYVDLSIQIPQKAEKDFYDLKVRVGARRGASFEAQYRINLKGEKHDMIIKKILMSSTVVAGRGLFANVKVENIGQVDEDDITIRLQIPELGISEFTTIDEVEAEDTTTSEDLVVFIDECVEAGEYDVDVIVEFDEYESITKATTITVTGSDICETGKDTETSKTVVSVPQAQEVKAGSSAVFPIMLTNDGTKQQNYVISVSGSIDSFATYRIDPGNVISVPGKESKTAFVFVTVNKDATAGAKDFIVTIQSGDDSQDVALTANVVGDSSSTDLDLRKALELGLVVLIVILVIAGIILGFNKLKPKDEESDEELGQTYY